VKPAFGASSRRDSISGKRHRSDRRTVGRRQPRRDSRSGEPTAWSGEVRGSSLQRSLRL